MRAGHSEIVVDGYNLIHKLFLSSESVPLEVLREETEKKLLSFQLETRSPVTIVYDGKGGREESACGAPLHIIFTPASISADQWIIDYVKSLNPKIKLVTIVSSDEEIRRYGTAFGATCIKSEEFVLQLKKTGNADSRKNRYIRSGQLSLKEKKFNDKLLSDQEVDRWMKLFTPDIS